MSPRAVTFFKTVFLLAILAGGCQPTQPTAPSASQPLQVASVNSSTEWGQSAGGLRSRIWADKHRFREDEPIVMHYEIQNVADKPLTVWHSGFWPNHRIDVTGPDGQPAKFSSGGNAHWSTFTPSGTREKNAPLILQPGTTDNAYEAYDLRVIYNMSATGEYFVQYVYQDGKDDQPVTSNSLQIFVE